MKIREVVKAIEDIAPLGGAAPWDRSGVQIAGTAKKISKIAVTIDPTPAKVAAAIEGGARFILTHHPLYMDPKPLDAPGNFLDTVRLVLGAGAWLYAAHTSLDVRPEGPAGWLPRALALSGCRVMEAASPNMADSTPETGFGLIGDLPSPVSFDDFADDLARHVARSFWVMSGPVPETVSRVAVCPGSGGSLIPRAEELCADVFITGDVKYHQAMEARVAVIDVGHFSLEETMTQFFARELAARLDGKAEVAFLPGTDPMRSRATG